MSIPLAKILLVPLALPAAVFALSQSQEERDSTPEVPQVKVAEVQATTLPDFLGWVPDELIVVLNEGVREEIVVAVDAGGSPRVSDPAVQGILDQLGVTRFQRQFANARPQQDGSPYPDLTGYYKVRIPRGVQLETALDAFESIGEVEHVERIGIHKLYGEANDPYYKDSPNPSFPYDQWHLYGTNGIGAETAWDSETGSTDVLVGILDSGTRYFHVDIGGNSAPWGPDAPFAGGNVFVNPGETPGNGTDDDGNGYVDDTIGYDFVETSGGFGVNCIDDDCGTADNDPDDFNGHGTHVGGTVGAITNNGVLVAGVAGGFGDGTASGAANGAKLVAMRIGYHARYQGVTTGVVRMDYAAEAMNYLAGLVDAGHNVAAINCSWGSSNSGGLGAAVANLAARDVAIIEAAGNSNSTSQSYLASQAGVWSVAATDAAGQGASFSNHGAWVDVAAPGVQILSTFRSPDDPDPTANYIALLDGTSMAAPHVAGIVALLESADPSLTAGQKLDLILNTATPYSDSRNLGSGIANARLALDAIGGGCDVTADFGSSSTSICVGGSVGFADASSGPISTWSWDFGDGNGSTLQDPTHTYTAAGTYTVSLTVTSAACSDTETRVGYVTVSAGPIADFGAAPTAGTAPLEVSFSDLSSGAPGSWSWTFGDGGTSAAQNPTYTYAAPGTYDVSLTVTSTCGTDANTKLGYIVVDEAGNPTDVLVSSIVVVKVNDGQGFKHGEATITVIDDTGAPVAGATVTGDFSGKTTDVGVSGATGGNGQVTLSSSSAKGGGEWCFEVTSVQAAGLTYTGVDNVVTSACESGPQF